MSAHRLDLKGICFGDLTAMCPAEDQGNRSAWFCMCSCGREIVVKTKYLRSGRTTHCGCRESTNGLSTLHYVDGSCIEMLESKTIRKNNSSGHTGVFFDKATRRWRAEMMLQGKRKYLGRFDTMEEAVAKREEAEQGIRQEFIDRHKAN